MANAEKLYSSRIFAYNLAVTSSFLQRLSFKARTIQLLSNWAEVWIQNRRSQPVMELKFRNGFRLTQGAGDILWELFVEIFLERCYESEGNLDSLKSGAVVIDAGANIGVFAHFLEMKCPGIQIHCFEPAANTRERLEKNLGLNGLLSLVKVHPFGIMDREQKLSLNSNSISGNRSLFLKENESSAETIDCISLSQAIARTSANQIDFLKMDIEGAEIEAFAGLSHEDAGRIRRVAIEYHDNLRPDCRLKLENKLKELGFVNIRAVPQTPDAGILFAERS